MRTEDLMQEAMTTVGSHWRTEGKTLSAFLGVEGAKYDHELMIVGRSVNGWSEWTKETLDNADAMRNFVSGLRRPDGACPLSWVTAPPQPNKYNPRRSAYWRTARKLREALTGETLDDETWPSHLAWSNLYKISRDAGNPPDWMCAAQERQCIEILREEIDQFRPNRVLFSTGLDWAEPFVKVIGRLSPVPSPHYVEAVGRISVGDTTVPCVVATHPMTKPETDWTSEVVAAFEEARSL